MSDVTPMVIYLNAHMAVDQMRTMNETEGKIGAKVGQLHRLMNARPSLGNIL